MQIDHGGGKNSMVLAPPTQATSANIARDNTSSTGAPSCSCVELIAKGSNRTTTGVSQISIPPERAQQEDHSGDGRSQELPSVDRLPEKRITTEISLIPQTLALAPLERHAILQPEKTNVPCPKHFANRQPRVGPTENVGHSKNYQTRLGIPADSLRLDSA